MLAIHGSYTDNFTTDHVITDATWTQTYPGSAPSLFNISQFHNNTLFLVAHNDATNMYSPNLWSRFDWVYDDAGALWYCQTAYDAADEAAALAVTRAEATTPSTGGCGGAAWSRLSSAAALQVIGAYTDNGTTEHAISASAWVQTYPGSAPSTFEISQFSNRTQHLVAHNAVSNMYSPNLWSRFDWVYDQAGALWYCQSAFDAADENAALAVPRPDATNPASGGCGGTFPWSNLTP